MLTGLCLITAQQCTLWARFAPPEFKGACLKPLENCATCRQGHASPGNVCHRVKSLMWRAKWLRRMHPAYMHGVRGGDWVQEEEFVLMNKGFTAAGLIPSLAQRITWIPVQWVGEAT